ncbi:cyclic AMP-dependent transcription factor ATF-3-like [Ptychodera flava]|uniref:cyclic AMP-dependent transcription factor ATF-3-like n=1 Tax=Ptychodera flava TaxID=63121 RepID=UPI00396A8794
MATGLLITPGQWNLPQHQQATATASNFLAEIFGQDGDFELQDCSTTVECLDDLDISISSLVKEELKHSIKSRRSSKGLPELTTGEEEPKSYQMTEEEIERRRLRRERNKVAAEKCRKKRKIHEERVIEEYKTQSELNTKLREEIKKLKKEEEELRMLLKYHATVCTLAV